MKKIHLLFIALILCLTTQNCKQKRQEEFLSFKKVKIDDNFFMVSISSKTKTDSTILYSDTIPGEIPGGEEIQTEWFNDSVKCFVPEYIPEKTFRTKTNLKVILKHK
jgi:hypothetical protein